MQGAELRASKVLYSHRLVINSTNGDEGTSEARHQQRREEHCCPETYRSSPNKHGLIYNVAI